MQPAVVVENAKAIQQTCYRALFQTSSPCHLSSPWPLQICLSHLAPVHSSFAETYHEAPCSSSSPSQSCRLVILAWLAAIETHKNMILQTTNKWWWWWVSQICQANLKFLPVLTQEQAVIGNRYSQNSQKLG